MSAAETLEKPFEIAFKGQLIGSHVRWKIDGTRLYKNGSLVVDLAAVKSGHWHEARHRGVELRTLKLKSEQGSVSIAVNGSAGQDNFRSFYQLAVTTLARTAIYSPNARINMGGGLGNMIMMFLLGLMFLALGVFCLVMGFGEAPWFIGLLGIPFVGIGAMLAVAMRPWNHHRLSIPPGMALAHILDK